MPDMAPRDFDAPDRTMWTIGHSTLTLDAFVELLEENGIRTLVDVRRYPGSRRHPHFAREALERSMTERGIGYRWLPELGGRRRARKDSRNDGWRNASFRGYADYMETPAFDEALALLARIGEDGHTAFMCAEHAWQQCHRGLISDRLKLQGVEVLHILGRGRRQVHPFTEPARVVAGRLTYAADVQQHALPL